VVAAAAAAINSEQAIIKDLSHRSCKERIPSARKDPIGAATWGYSTF